MSLKAPFDLPEAALFEVALFGIKGNARFVYLAQSEGLGPKSAKENAGPNGPTVQ
jgi:hypothetical protein